MHCQSEMTYPSSCDSQIVWVKGKFHINWIGRVRKVSGFHHRLHQESGYEDNDPRQCMHEAEIPET
jgi:hypothetical protein